MDDPRYETAVNVRYADLDTVGILNNAVCVTLFEEARIDYLREAVGIDPDAGDVTFVVAHLDLDYHRPVDDRGEATVGVDVTDVGWSSWTTAYELRFEGFVAATAEMTLVTVDGDGDPTPLPDDVRKGITE